MPAHDEAIDSAISETMAAQKRVSKIKSGQVRGVDEIAALKATAQTWFHTRRPVIATAASASELADIDGCFTTILNATVKHAAKSTYATALSKAKDALVKLRATALVATPAASVNSDDELPDFTPLVGNPVMREILARRWKECAKCVGADANLAGIVMMGGFLEALFVARANNMSDKAPLTTATNAPKDRSTGKVTNYQDWMLDSYIKVAFELKWITESAKDVADILKEYRNFVHPAKELRYGVTLGYNDSTIFWQVTKALARQLLLSAERVQGRD